jgi:hypothetical protein
MKPDAKPVDEALVHQRVHQADAAVHQDVRPILFLQIAD